MQQLGVGEDRAVAALVEVDERRVTAASGGDVTIERVMGEVRLRADEPAERRRLPFEDTVPGPEPWQLFRRACPEAFGVARARPGSSVGRRD